MNIIKQTIPVILIFAMASIASPVGAQSVDVPKRGPMPFATFDKDGNGFVSEEEFNAARGERMAARAAEGRPMRGAASAPPFSALDTNSDGQLTQSELAAGQKAQMEKRRGMGMGRGMGMEPGYGQGMGMGPGYGPCMGVNETAQQGYQMRGPANAPSFADIDVNGDGAISPDEFNAHRAQRRQRGTQ